MIHELSLEKILLTLLNTYENARGDRWNLADSMQDSIIAWKDTADGQLVFEAWNTRKEST